MVAYAQNEILKALKVLCSTSLTVTIQRSNPNPNPNFYYKTVT